MTHPSTTPQVLSEDVLRQIEETTGGCRNCEWLLLSHRTLAARLEVAEKALENCLGGDLGSGDGIYKAELAREALAKIRGEG